MGKLRRNKKRDFKIEIVTLVSRERWNDWGGFIKLYYLYCFPRTVLLRNVVVKIGVKVYFVRWMNKLPLTLSSVGPARH